MSANDYATIGRIRRFVKQFSKLSDEALQQRGLALKYDAMTGAKIDRLIPESFALVSESARRSTGMIPYDVQLLGGIQIARGHVAEMKSGEGKTLTATLPAYLHALYAKGAHVVTVNDYLAQRDYDLMSGVFRRLGLSTGVIVASDEPDQRRVAYQKDVTYGTAKEFGFDFLRDRMKIAGQTSRLAASTDRVQRELNFVLVDEADSVLIDEARTPLIVGIVNQEEEAIAADCFNWASRYSDSFERDVDYTYEFEKRKVELTHAGIDKLRRLPQTQNTTKVSIKRLYNYMENAIKVRIEFHLDQHYAVVEDKIMIIDEFTGRPAEGRQWQGGIHQSVEAKEGLEITPATGQGATVTLQSFFRLYRFFGGMSGTVWSSRREFKKVYRKKVVRIPTNKPIQRSQLPTRVYANEARKFDAVVDDVVQQLETGRAVLVGTRNVDQSERLSNLLREKDIHHQVLNAHRLDFEAEIVKKSGGKGCVTVATNMAGRGTDFMLDPAVRSAGGLHVILTEVHESQRIDWQLIGRGSRQGEPGSYRIFVSMEDEILKKGLGPEKADRLKKRFAKYKGALARNTFSYFTTAQRKVERKHLVDRMILLKQDQERHEQHFEMGQDPYCDGVRS